MASSSASSSHDTYREKGLALGHKIFLSYSGADHDFVYELYHDLVEHDYHPFFDQKSLPKGEAVSMGNIVQEVAHSKLAVFVLSEEFFTRNKNPMLELVECMEHGVRLLPLFYNISVDTIKSSVESWDRDKWTEWGVDQIKFNKALKTLLNINGIENKEGLRARDYRRRVLQEIQSIIPPDTLSYVSYICGGDRLVTVVKDLFHKYLLDEVCTYPVAALGLYGASGTGKSSLCKLLEHSGESLFHCRVCYIELDNAKDKTSDLARMKKFLKSVSNLSRDLVDRLTTIDQVQQKLYEQECKKVFLIIDNVITSDSLEEAKRYLDAQCHLKYGSKVLVTGHSKALLAGLAHVNQGLKWHIAAMPDLQKVEARQILLKRAGLISVNNDLVERCLNLCKFKKGGGKGVHHHPLLLNALAESLADDGDFLNQEKMALRIHSLELSFSHTDADPKEKVLQQMLKSTSYNSLNDLQKQVFLDIAFYLPRGIQGRDEIIEWLGMVHGKNTKESVWILEKRGLIDLSALRNDMHTDCSYCSFEKESLMHDLYYEMASLIVQEDGSKCLFIGGHTENKDLPPLHSCQQLIRVRFDMCYFSGGLVLHHHFPSLQVLDLRDSVIDRKLDLRGADHLRSLNIFEHKHNRTLSGVDHLRSLSSLEELRGLQIQDLDDCYSLCHLSIVRALSLCSKIGMGILKSFPTFDFPIPAERKRSMGNIPKLENFILSHGSVVFDPPLDISSCTRITKLCLHGNKEQMTVSVLPSLTNLQTLFLRDWEPSGKHGPVQLDFGHNIESVYITSCYHVSALRGLDRNCTFLKKLSLHKCTSLKDFEFLGELTSLERVSLSQLQITALPKQLLKLGKQLQQLEIIDCYFIRPQDWVAVLSTPNLPRESYAYIIFHLMQMYCKIMGEIDNTPHPFGGWAYPVHKCSDFCHNVMKNYMPSPWWDLESWKTILSLLVESTEALDTISEQIRHIHRDEILRPYGGRYHKSSLLALVLHLCVGGRYVHLKELLSKPHVLRAIIGAERPFGLILLAIAKQHFGANIEACPSAITSMVAKAYMRNWNEYPHAPHFVKCARECAAYIAFSSTYILEKLPTKIRHHIVKYPIRYNAHSSYDFRKELNYSNVQWGGSPS